MADFLATASEITFSEIEYTYNEKNEYSVRFNLADQTYNKDMKSKFIYLQNKNSGHQEIDEYFKQTAKKYARVQLDKKKVGGMPVIKNTRIPVSLIVACLKDEMTVPEICEEYRLIPEDIEMAMQYVIEILDTPYQEG